MFLRCPPGGPAAIECSIVRDPRAGGVDFFNVLTV